jgi:hypothetical protein
VSNSAAGRTFERARGRARWLGFLGVAAAGIVGCTQVGGSPGSTGTEISWASTQSQASPKVSASPLEVSASPLEGSPVLLLLGGTDAASYDLWTYDLQQGWAKLGSGDGAAAIGRNETTVALGGAHGIATRPLGEYSAAQATHEQNWTVVQPIGTIASVALSPSGRSALIDLVDSTPTYMVQGSSGRFATLSPGPRQPFSFLVGWLGDRILALSVDDMLMSRLCVIDPAAGSSTLLNGLIGVRVFAVSPDGSLIAAATEEAVYLGPTSAWLANERGQLAVPIPEGNVVWDLALDSSGMRLALLSGELGADGTATDWREIAYESTPSGWQKVFEADLPFASVGGQIWLS